MAQRTGRDGIRGQCWSISAEAYSREGTQFCLSKDPEETLVIVYMTMVPSCEC